MAFIGIFFILAGKGGPHSLLQSCLSMGIKCGVCERQRGKRVRGNEGARTENLARRGRKIIII